MFNRVSCPPAHISSKKAQIPLILTYAVGTILF